MVYLLHRTSKRIRVITMQSTEIIQPGYGPFTTRVQALGLESVG